MKRTARLIGITIILLSSLLINSEQVFAICKAPPGPAFTTCSDAGYGYACNIYNDQTGTNDLMCCSAPQDCANFTPPQSGAGISTSATGQICNFAGDKGPDCRNCMDSGGGVWTAIGCIHTEPGRLFTDFFSIGIGLAGGIAFLLILFGGFQILTSAGNPEQLNAGKELVGSAIAGLLLIVFSVFILKFVGYNILRIPGFL